METTKKTQEEWDLFFLRLCREYSTASKDPSTKVGSCIVGPDKRVYAAGYNGFSSNDPDNFSDLLDRSIKMEKTIHAEVNALNHLRTEVARKADTRYTLYVYPLAPCTGCCRQIIDSGIIERVVSTDYKPERWVKNINNSIATLMSACLELELYPITKVL